MFMALGGLCYLVGFVCWIFIIIHAFKEGGALQGILCLCVPFYVLYYAFAKFTHEKKNMILGGFLGGFVVGAALMVLQVMMAKG